MTSPSVSRRTALKGLAGASAAAALGGCASLAKPDPNRIVLENSKPGTRDWLLTNTRVDPATKWRCPWIEGYCSHTRARAGDELSLFVSTNPASPFTVDIYRLGYYGGAGGRLMRSFEPIPGKPQPEPPVGAKRLRNCAWEPAVTFRIPADWPSGVYLGKLTEQRTGLQSYVVFIVRDDRPAGLLFQCSDHTWQAYNRWPTQFALYDDGKDQWYWGGGVQVGFNRPYGRYCQIFDAPLSQGSGEFLLWEFPVAYWLEQHGYDVTYTSNSDMIDPAEFLRTKVFLSVGHDEYWDPRQYDNALASIQQGTTHLYLSGNAVMGLTPFQPSEDGRPNRVISREGVYGGVYGGLDEFFKYPFPREGPKANLQIGRAHV